MAEPKVYMLTPIEVTEQTKPTDGTYQGTMSGYSCFFSAIPKGSASPQSQNYAFENRLGVRGINCKVTVHVVNGVPQVNLTTPNR